MNAAFVAEARRTYVPAAKWARANGFERHAYGDSGRRIILWALGDERPMVQFEQRGSQHWIRMQVWPVGLVPNSIIYPTSFERAIDTLVDLGILPGPMHSLMQVHAETARFEAEGRDGGRLIFGDVAGFSPARRGGKELWLDLEQDLSWLTADDAGEATELGWRRLWVATS